MKKEILPACTMVIFGATGDLTKRLLLPSIYNLAAMGVLPDSFRILGVAVDAWNEDKFRAHVGDSLKQFWGGDADAKVVEWLSTRSYYFAADFGNPAAFDALRDDIATLEKADPNSANRLFYLAVAPSFISPVAEQLSRTGLLKEDGACWRRLVVEKPFGHDLESAKKLNAELQSSLREDQIYRIDHFAGKDAVQDLAVFRFSNAIWEPLWSRSAIDSVQITAAETVGVELRAGYYETAGATRDMVPNHLCELLSLVAMEPPVSFDAAHMRAKQVELMESIRDVCPEDVNRVAVRGQYAAGSMDGKDVADYRHEPGVKPDSTTETFVAMKVKVENWRWSGVPFYLRTGKRLSRQKTEIVVTFKQPPARLFPGREVQPPNQLLFNLQPDPGIHLTFGSKAPGLSTCVEQGTLSFDLPGGAFGTRGKGYERLLADIMKGDMTLFQPAEFVQQGWRMVQPLLDAWQPGSSAPMAMYAAGSQGPEAADKLLTDSGRCWHSMEAVVPKPKA